MGNIISKGGFDLIALPLFKFLLTSIEGKHTFKVDSQQQLAMLMKRTIKAIDANRTMDNTVIRYRYKDGYDAHDQFVIACAYTASLLACIVSACKAAVVTYNGEDIFNVRYLHEGASKHQTKWLARLLAGKEVVFSLDYQLTSVTKDFCEAILKDLSYYAFQNNEYLDYIQE